MAEFKGHVESQEDKAAGQQQPEPEPEKRSFALVTVCGHAHLPCAKKALRPKSAKKNATTHRTMTKIVLRFIGSLSFSRQLAHAGEQRHSFADHDPGDPTLQ
ncbi:MAG: hypothetical protein WA463_11020 [Terriglobales bacterium]